MSNKSKIVSTLVPILISVALVIVIAFVGYYFVVVLPKKEEMKTLLEIERMEMSQEISRKKVYKDCNAEAAESAKGLLESKIKIGALTDARYQEGLEEGLFLQDDYDDYYTTCLKRHGIVE